MGFIISYVSNRILIELEEKWTSPRNGNNLTETHKAFMENFKKYYYRGAWVA